LPELRKLRKFVDEVYWLYDRRCRRKTAFEKLRERLKRFGRLSQLLKKIESPAVDRRLVLLDDRQLPSTSTAVERGNRRFCKMQKTVYRVRTWEHIKQRVSLDMVRDLRLPARKQTIQTEAEKHLSNEVRAFCCRLQSAVFNPLLTEQGLFAVSLGR